MYKILIVDDDEQMRVALCATTKHFGFESKSVKNGAEALKLVAKEDFDVIVSDLKMPKMDGIELLEKVKEIKDIPFVMITAVGTIQNAVESMKLGAFDFILKPFSAETFKKVIDLAISHKNIYKNAHIVASSKARDQKHFVVESQSMNNILKIASKVAKTDATVLLAGESGTGKEMLAKYIHINSPRRNKKFVAINCAAIPANLLESELFGYEKGAFSGANKTHQGKFEQANQGTLLLDEITEMPLELQVKILRVLQEKTVDKIGSKTPVNIDLRIVCTTNRNIEEEVKKGNFREDLYYRINVFPIKIPPLRERSEDIEPLSMFFLKKYSQRFGKNITSISEDALKILQKYNWPGNVRELENVIERSVVLSDSDVILKEDIFLHNL